MSGPTGQVGWGQGGIGSAPWGGSLLTALQLAAAVAVRENVVQLKFTRPVYWSGLLDLRDASKTAFYVVTATAGTVGLDGSPVHPVSVVAATVSESDLPPGSAPGQFLDLTLDRPMTPYPSTYSVSVSGLVSADGATPLTSPTTAQFYGAFKEVVVPDVASPHPSRDFANPQTLSAILDSGLPNTATGSTTSPRLAVFGVDDSGDYAFDSGLTSLKKRIYRRLMTSPGGFAHLGDGYGVGLTREGKKLALAATIGRITANAEAQISREPEVAKVDVTARNDNTGLVRIQIRVRTKHGTAANFFVDLPTK